ncbi:Activator of Hsp90 ATPase 1 family protein [Methylocella silvestris BL2]|uniref:Activator of Hsp90 ATPase 1 family protein n=1 Tax=Methylocella silvestris (strain DSM 15510 / CIP 108128 / LMG 27833 / NCIMB 13906 / BL2) TaxID=395965 RepID=B8ET10_METSB|nr:SRPBCC family protein [Methylocella silvestris]ACK51148.1 Activator of Hsp90 ATPase 1 family protein [Methylocella silvestris BL2]
MAQSTDADNAATLRQPPPLLVSRAFHARRETVFKAWSTAEHVKNWFSPKTYSVAEAKVEMRVGGAFEVCMLSPTGERHWSRGVFVEVTPHSRLVIDMHATDLQGRPLFRAYTEVTFADGQGETRMDVMQTYTFIDPSMAAPIVAGASEGWRTTLDKLEQEVLRISGAAGVQTRSVVHASFHIERRYNAPVERVWKALTDEAAKQKWFGGPPSELDLIERYMDVREGGRERAKGRWQSGVVSTFDAIYHDVVVHERLVYSYVMHLDDKKISVSLATMQLKIEDGGTRLKVTEQGAFLDGYDDAGSREHGAGYLLDRLGASLDD